METKILKKGIGYLEKAIKEQEKNKNISKLLSKFCGCMEEYSKKIGYKKMEKKMKVYSKIFKSLKKKPCETCGDEGVAWLLSPCTDCEEGKRVKKIGEQVTKNLTNNKIKTKKVKQ